MLARVLLRARQAPLTATTRRPASTTTTGGGGSESIAVWDHVPKGPLDSNKATTVAYKADTFGGKINLGEGIYKDDDGHNWVLPSVRAAEERLFQRRMDHEYAPITGIPRFTQLAQELLFGASHPLVRGGAIVTTQTLSGTGSLRVAADFLRRFYLGRAGSTQQQAAPSVTVLMSDPTWVNHAPIFRDAGFAVGTYRYFDAARRAITLDGMLADLDAAPRNSIAVLHACAHNPTGADPSLDQWAEISRVCQRRQHLVLFDTAYQGFASGDPVRDAAAIALFIERGHRDLVVCQSFAKSFGLYGERAGAASFLCRDAAVADAVDSQLKIMIRAQYSNPPIYGARLVAEVLGDDALRRQWIADIGTMSSRIASMRRALVDNLRAVGSRRSWDHIAQQIGMFAYSGLTEPQVARLRAEHHVYCNKDGRMSMSGVNSKNVKTLAAAIHAVTKE